MVGDANICLDCGLDFRTGKRVARPSAASAGDEEPQSRGSLRTVRMGLNLMCVAILTIAVSNLIGLIPALAAQMFGLIPLGFGVVAGTLASILCVFVPNRTGALPPIVAKLVLDGSCVFILIGVLGRDLPRLAAAAIPFLMLASCLCFIFFMKHLALHLRRQDIADNAMSLIWFGLILGLGGIGAGAAALLSLAAGMVVMLGVSLGSIALTFKFGLVVRELAVATRRN